MLIVDIAIRVIFDWPNRPNQSKMTDPDYWPNKTSKNLGSVVATTLEMCGVWFFPLLLRFCVLKIDSCSWYDSWLHKNYRLLLLFNSCHKSRKVQKDINIPKHCDWKSLLFRLLFQSKISTSGPAPVENC